MFACAMRQVPDDLREIRQWAVDSIARGLLRDSLTPGLAVTVIRKGEVLHRAAYGLASLLPERRVTLHTPFYIASTGKMLTAAAVLRLVDLGVLRLEDSIGRHLPEVPSYAALVTVEQLLTNTSGLVNHYDIGGTSRSYSNDEVLQILREFGSFVHAPGSRFHYSNSGYVLLSLLVERLTGMPFHTFLEREFFGPFGMTDAFVAPGAAPSREAAALGYAREGGRYVPDDYRSTTTGAGGIYASVVDLERWLLALRHGQVISDSLLERAVNRATVSDGQQVPYGMGWELKVGLGADESASPYIFAFGGLNGFRSLFEWDRDRDTAVIWLSNGAGLDVLEAMQEVPQLVHAGHEP